MNDHVDLARQKYQASDFTAVVELLQPFADNSAALPLPDLVRLAQSCFKLGRFDEAGRYYREAAERPGAPRPQLVELAFNAFRKAENVEGAFEAARQVLGGNPRHKDAAAYHRHHVRHRLDMDELASSDAQALAGFRAGDPFVIANELLLDHIAWCGDEAINSLIRHQNGKDFDPAVRASRRARSHRFSDPIRVGYLSNDFSSSHATMKLMQRVFDLHDSAAIDVTLFCHTPPRLAAAGSDFRRRHAERLVPIGHLSTEAGAAEIRGRGIDILVDLKGHTHGAWIDLVNSGLAPIQVAYLGFPGSGVGIDCDYILCDRVVCPPQSAPHFLEKFCWLPDSYQANDDHYRPLPPATPRDALGLPSDKVVFVSANTERKITPETLDLWMRVMARMPDSVLWMICPEGPARANFLRAVAGAGIAPERIIFAHHAAYAEHIARLQAADIGLDTFPCNGHTTTSDKLWAGLPVVSKKGGNFSSRVSESLLRAMDLGELVAEDGDGFVEICVALATEPRRLAALKARIAASRDTAPLFDSERLTRHLESAYRMMVERARSGLAPDHIEVPSRPPRTTTHS